MLAAVEGKGGGWWLPGRRAGELITRDRAVLTLSRGVSCEDAAEDVRLQQRQVNRLPDVDRDRLQRVRQRPHLRPQVGNDWALIV